MSETNVKRISAKMRFKFRSDTLANWRSNNPILLEGEAGVVTGLNAVGDGLEDKTRKIKFGDGIHAWDELDWWYGPEGQGSGSSITIDQTYNPESPNAQSGIAVAEALANLPSGSGDFEQIGDVILTEPVNEVVFSEFETPLKDYKQIFMVSAFGVDGDASGAFKIRSAGGGLYFMWSGLGAISANTNYGFWHSIEQMGVDDYPIYKSTYSSQKLNNMGSDIGNLTSQGLDANNVAVKSDYTHHNAIIEEYRFGVPSNVKFIAGSRFILFGRK